MELSPALAIDRVSYRYADTPVLREVSLTIPRGKCFALLGPNGSGKSTLLNLICGNALMQDGDISVMGLGVRKDMQRIRQVLGVTFQTPSLDKKLSVAENLRYHGYLYGLHGAELAEAIDVMIQDFELETFRHKTIETLSGGYKRRVELAKAVLVSPKILLLDEPTTGLDPAARQSLWAQLRRLQASGVTVVFTTHLMDEAEASDVVALMHQGRIVKEGTPLALKQTLSGQLVVVKTSQTQTFLDRLAPHWSGSMKVTQDDVRMLHEAPLSLIETVVKVCGDVIDEITLRYPTLEDVFMHATGAHLRGQSLEA